ncbi:P-loop containing nucleoside triphosphate hydrolase protein [Ilyonectria sp. MPI-CAGE-AT-0026]|nr:P-loop containing nucleoside triphosphate hydrolase protein [Ilyonectria sp. MPI-CAGE-AT-0026]
MASSTEFHAPVTGHYNIPAPHASHGGSNNFYFNAPSNSTNTNSPRRPIPSYPLHSIAPTKTFVQRPALRESIREQLLRPLDVNRPGEVKKVGVWGMGGAGKSQLALSYLAYYRTEYDATFWIQADQAASIDRDFLAIYRLMPQSSFLPPPAPAEVKLAVLSWFARESGKWLLVFDGADYLLKTDRDYVPLSEYFPASSNIHIIITSRASIAKALSTFEGVPVGDLEESQSVELFLNCAEMQSSQEKVLSQVKEIVHEMGYLALAINIAGKFVSQNPRLRSNLSEYLTDFRRRRHNLLSEKPEELIERYNHSVMTVWETSYSAVYEQLPEACRLLTLLSFIHNEDIFLEMFGLDSESNSISGPDSAASTDAIAVLDSISDSDAISDLRSISVIPWTSIFKSQIDMDFHRLEECFSLLEKYSLCQSQATRNSYSIHRLIHCWGYDRKQGDGDEIKKFWHAASQFLKEYLEAIGDSSSTPASKLRLVPHLVENTQSYRRISKTFLWDQCGPLRYLEGFAQFFSDIGRWQEAELVHTEVLKDKSQTLGNEHPNTLTAMENLATTLLTRGQLSKAAEIQREVLQKKQRILGNENPHTLIAMGNLASILRSQGQLSASAEMQRELLLKLQRILGSEHPYTLTTTNNLALTLRDQGQLSEAAEMWRELLPKLQRIRGSEHPDTLTTMNNLAITLRDQGQFDEAVEISKDVLEKSRRILGNEHPDTLLSMHNLAFILDDQGQFDGALGILRDVTEKRARILGNEHHSTLLSMHTLAFILNAQGQFDEALGIFRDVVDKRARILGNKHPDTISSMQLLSEILSRKRIVV